MIQFRPSLYTDFYELTMAQGFYLENRHLKTASFDYFFRKQPFNGGYTLFAGLETFLSAIEEYEFSKQDLDFLESNGFQKEFLNYLKTFQFKGNIIAANEGEIVFPNEPILRVEGNILECQLVETLLLNFINFESLIATKASRIRNAAGDRTLLDFGLRRSQGLGGLQASRAAIIGGFDGSSNVSAGQLFDIPIGGTMAHLWIQSFEKELDAFRAYSKHYPDKSTLLVDTYDTLKSGVPNAIIVAKELEENGHKLEAIRLDSGDLAYFSKKARLMLDQAGLNYVRIAASNQLDEYVIKSLLDQKAPIDIFGVGTKLVTAYDYPALDGVYKLSSIDGKPSMKLSENIEKNTLPALKNITRFYSEDGSFYADGISLAEEDNFDTIQHPYLSEKKTNISKFTASPLLILQMANGKRITSPKSIDEIKTFSSDLLSKLNPEYKRFDNPHMFKVGISPALMSLRNKLIKSHKH